MRAIDCQAGSRSSLAWWSLAGLAQGLALWAKYTAVLVPVGLAVALLSRVEWRSRLREPGPYIGTLVAIAVFLPVFVWNARHGWASFRAPEMAPAAGAGLLANAKGFFAESLPVLLGAARPHFTGDPHASFPGALAVVPVLVAVLLVPAAGVARRDRRVRLLFGALVALAAATVFAARLTPSEPRYLAGYRQVANYPTPILGNGRFLNVTMRRNADTLLPRC